MSQPKLILLNGFAGNGKSTIGKLYADKHPLSLNIEGDVLISMIGKWKKYYKKARKTIFPLTKSIAKTYLELGYDVIIPYLLKDPQEAEGFEKLAQKASARFYEIQLYMNKNDAINTLLKRGAWGEEGATPFTNKDKSHISELYDSMEKATALRPNTIKISVKYGDIKDTYDQLLNILNSPQ